LLERLSPDWGPFLRLNESLSGGQTLFEHIEALH
jgi:hypothetical protein